MNDEGALITIYREKSEAEAEAFAMRRYFWTVVERYVY